MFIFSVGEEAIQKNKLIQLQETLRKRTDVEIGQNCGTSVLR